MTNVTREQAETTRDHAMNARTNLLAHTTQCRKCEAEGVPCELGGILQRGANKISQEAAHALAAYLPTGSTVTYHGHTSAYQGRVWTVAGPSPRAPWSGYVLVGDGVRPFVASLPSLRLSSREARRREHMATVHEAVSTCLAVLARYGVTIDVAVSISDAGNVRVSWTSSDVIRAETRAMEANKAEAGQYIGAALLLLQATRAHAQRNAWHEVKRDADNARRLAARADVRV